MILLPLTTSRLSIRMMRSLDVERFVEYRNQPDVARFQDWEVPFTVEMGRRLIDEQAALDGPTNDSWVQLALELAGTTIGDVAVAVRDAGRQATIGYSIITDAQGYGYATEAVGAVVDALFDEAGIHRIVASIDPGNGASRRVLEKLGFRFEGCSPSSAFVRGAWVDDDHFAQLATEHAARSAGPISPGRART
jgi:aminoglycoside 6'-N-acetyltransferase